MEPCGAQGDLPGKNFPGRPPPPTHPPLICCNVVVQALVNEDKLDKSEAGEVNEIEKDLNKTENDNEKENTISSIEICNKENAQITPMTDEECDALFKKLLAPLYHSVNELNAVAAGIIQDNNLKTDEINKNVHLD